MDFAGGPGRSPAPARSDGRREPGGVQSTTIFETAAVNHDGGRANPMAEDRKPDPNPLTGVAKAIGSSLGEAANRASELLRAARSFELRPKAKGPAGKRAGAAGGKSKP